MSAFHSLSARPPHGPQRGFTLLELIISVALVLVLMLAITKIFSITSTTIGASQGIAAATRDARAAQAVFARDIGSMASDTPFIWIRSDPSFGAFRNAADEAADKDGDTKSIDLDGANTDNDPGGNVEGDNNVPGETFSTIDLNYRNHRLDRFSFCARDRFVRQTGNSAGNVLVSGLTSSEAWISYSPLCLPNNNGAFQLSNTSGKTVPGAGNSAGDNPNNYYASQWILGRFAPLMILPPGYPGVNTISEGTVAQEFYPHITAGASLAPFDSASVSNVAPTSSVLNARYDLVGLDIATTKTVLKNYGTNWRTNFCQSLFEVNPFIIKPINASTAARQVPIFVNACSQFIIEFAGDFVAQDADGIPIDTNADTLFNDPDGQIDFAIVNGVRQIKWYGYPRDMNGDGTVTVGQNSPDVAPVTDFICPLNTQYAATNTAYSEYAINFETFTGGTGVKQTRKTYPSRPLATYKTYYAAWGPESIDNPLIPRPKMYRITMTIDRPEMAGRSADGQTFEYVFTVP